MAWKMFQKDGYFSKTAVILVITWIVVLIKYILAGITIFGFTMPSPNTGLTIGILTAVSALYFGNHNITRYRAEIRETPKDRTEQP